MNEDSGVSIQDVQYMICKGTYGRKEWSASEREIACQQYEEMTGVDPRSGITDTLLMAGIVVVILLSGIALGYTLRKYKVNRKNKNSRKKTTPS